MKKQEFRFWLWVVFCIQSITSLSQSFGYENPVVPGMNPDPTVCRAGEDYYLVTSSFVQNPGLPIYHSKDLIHWELINYVCKEENGFDVSKGSGLYAPTIRYNEADETFYVICTNMRNGGNFITYTQNPRGTWSNLKYLEHKEMHGIDPSLMFDADGKCYFTATHADGIIQAEIDPKSGKALTEPRLIWGGTGGRYPEGPHLYHVPPYYYLIISEGGTEYGHHVVASRSNSPWGPFEECPYNPILSHVEKIAQSNPIQCTGHSDLVRAHDGSWWAVFLATRPVGGNYHLGRETYLSPINWTRDYWPMFHTNGTVDLYMPVKTLPQTSGESRFTGRYEFDGAALPLEWNHYRHPKKEHCVLRDGQLVLSAESNKDATFVGVRQCDFDVTLETCISAFSAKGKGEAGLSVRHGQGQHYDVYLMREGKQHYVASRFKFGMVNQVEKKPIPADAKVWLRIVAEKRKYTLYYSLDSRKWEKIGAMDSHFLGGGFSGLLVGLFADAPKGASCTAAFEYFDYIVKP